jgi:hypothetical protein
MSLFLVPVSFALTIFAPTTIGALAQTPSVTPGATPSPAATPGATPSPGVGGYPAKFAEGYAQNCLGGIIQQSPSAPPNLVLGYCQCIATQVQSQLPYRDFIDLDNALTAKQTLSERQTRSNAVLTQVAQGCQNQVRQNK